MDVMISYRHAEACCYDYARGYADTCTCCDCVVVVILGREISGKLDTLTMTSLSESVPPGHGGKCVFVCTFGIYGADAETIGVKIIAGCVMWRATAMSSWNRSSEEPKLCKFACMLEEQDVFTKR